MAVRGRRCVISRLSRIKKGLLMCCPGGEGTSATGETIREGQGTPWLGPGGRGGGGGGEEGTHYPALAMKI